MLGELCGLTKDAAGTTYTFTTQLGTLEDSVLRLYDANGYTQLALNDDYGGTRASQITWTAAADCSCYVAVGGLHGWESGSYTLDVRTDQ